ncbi:hypothetical protein [Pedobacter steynii]|nr:hypothetical protein [Pedobacter steynii]
MQNICKTKTLDLFQDGIYRESLSSILLRSGVEEESKMSWRRVGNLYN